MEDKNLENVKSIDRLIEFLATKSLHSYTKIEKHIGLGNGYVVKSRQRDGHLSGAILQKVAIMYPDLNLRWLVTGEGNMHTDAVKHSLQNDPNMTQEIVNLTRLLADTQKKLLDKIDEVDQLKEQKNVSGSVPIPKLRSGES